MLLIPSAKKNFFWKMPGARFELATRGFSVLCSSIHDREVGGLHYRTVGRQSSPENPFVPSDFFPLGVTQQASAKVADKSIGRHGLEGVGGEVVFQKSIKRFASDGVLDEAQEMEALVVGDGGDAVVRVAADEVDG